MKIFRVLGLGLAIIMLKFLIPEVFSGFENVILAFFDTVEEILAADQMFLPASVPSVPGL